MNLRISSLVVIVACGLVAIINAAAPEQPLVDDRTAIELVHYNHRLGQKPPFRDALPSGQIEKMVALDLKKEAVLNAVYGVEVTTAMVDAEVKRIDATTRAPDVLAELKAAVGNDLGRFARSIAKPIVVERLLRARFENDDKLHGAERGRVVALRTRLLEARDGTYANRLALIKAAKLGDVPELTWQMTRRPPDDQSRSSPGMPAVSTEIKARSGAYSIVATAQMAQVLASPESSVLNHEGTHYFEDLPPELQNVLRAQLVNPGDVSAVIETSQGFLLYLARERSGGALSVALLSVPKRNYDEWLSKQPD
jgi:hypothetical protein